MENEYYFEGTNEIANFVQKKSIGALRKRLSGVPSYTIYKISKKMSGKCQNIAPGKRLSRVSPYIIYRISKNMEDEHYFEGTNENGNFVQKRQKEPPGIGLSVVPSYKIYKCSKKIEGNMSN